MPLYNWFKLTEKRNLTFLRKKPLDTYENTEKLMKRWYAIHDEYLNKFGYGEAFQKLLKLKKEHIKKLSNFLISSDKFNLTEAEMISSDIEQLMRGMGNVSDSETVMMIESRMGFKIDTKKITVFDYYNYLDFIGKVNNN